MTDATVARSERPADQSLTARLDALRGIDAREYGVRFIFGVVVSLVAGVIGQLFGAKVGGLFLGFPAILPATLTLLEKKEGTAQSVSDLRGAIIGGVGLIAFGVVAALLMRHSAALALVLALVAWTVAATLLFLGLRGLARVLGERHYLPEIPATEVAGLVGELQRRHLTVATAESCTGGLLGALLAAVPGAGEVYRGSVVAYSNGAKSKLLDIPATLLETDGAVSDRAARALAMRVQDSSGADVAIGITGVAGRPVEGKPPGRTYVAVALPGAVTRVRRLDDDLGPGRNQEQAVRAAVRLAVETLQEGPGPLTQPGAPHASR